MIILQYHHMCVILCVPPALMFTFVIYRCRSRWRQCSFGGMLMSSPVAAAFPVQSRRQFAEFQSSLRDSLLKSSPVFRTKGTSDAVSGEAVRPVSSDPVVLPVSSDPVVCQCPVIQSIQFPVIPFPVIQSP